jgi:hypothetical protein
MKGMPGTMDACKIENGITSIPTPSRKEVPNWVLQSIAGFSGMRICYNSWRHAYYSYFPLCGRGLHIATARSDGIDTVSSDEDDSSESMTSMDEKEQERESGCTYYTNTRSDNSSVGDEEQQEDSPTSFLDDNMLSLPWTIELLSNLHATAANNRCEDDDGRSTSDSDNSSTNIVNKNSKPLLP